MLYNRIIALGTVVSFMLSGCYYETATQSDAPDKEKKQFEMYEQSEMAGLMLQMHSFSQQLKEKIQAGEELPAYPEHFERLFEAELTPGKTRDDFFIEHAEIFLEAQKSLHSDNESDKKAAFNTMVNKCIACHRQKCTGPIPKIEKLYVTDIE
jgi:cytochrome c553